MTRILGSIAGLLLGAWIVADPLFVGPVRDVAPVTLTWAIGLTAASGIRTALAVLAGAAAAHRRVVRTRHRIL